MTTSDRLLTTLVTLSGLALAVAAAALGFARRLARRVAAIEARQTVLPPDAPFKPDPAPQSVAPGASTRRVDREMSSAVSGPILISVPNLASVPAQPRAPESVGKYAAIWEMADSGTSPQSIARQTGQPIGQIELILGLKRQRPAPRGPRLP